MSQFNPKSLEFCTNCETDRCVPCVVDDAINSEEGQLLMQNPPRYGDFMWHNEDRFRNYMGNDVDPLMHGPYQAVNVAIPMIEAQNSNLRYEPFTKVEAKLLVMAHVVHDFHEGLTGDIPAPQKTEQTALSELEINQQVVSKILGLSVEHPFMTDLKQIMGDTQGHTKLGRAFNVSEQIGYFQTGLKAWSLKDHQKLTPAERAESKRMGHDVVIYSYQKIKNGATEFAYCRDLLVTNYAVVREIEDGGSV